VSELLGTAYIAASVFKSAFSNTCVTLWLLIVFSCLLKKCAKNMLEFLALGAALHDLTVLQLEHQKNMHKILEMQGS
jgi:hypothetical protein